MHQSLSLTALALILSMLFGCDNASNTSYTPGNSALQGQDAGAGTFLSADGSLKAQCPQGWAVADLNDDADLEVANVNDDTYLLVMSEFRADYAGDLAQHSSDTRSTLVSSLTNVTQEGPTELTINGSPAIQYKIIGTFDRTNIIYLHTTIQTEEKFHQVLTWTVASRFKKSEPTLQQIIGTIEEVVPGA